MEKATQEFPGYRIGGLLHNGATSVVYRAQRLSDDKSVVIKSSWRGALSARQHTRIQNEYELLHQLDSVGIVKAYDLIWQEGRLALILEDFPGLSLKKWLADGQPSLEERLDIAIDLAGIVGDVHSAGLVHKDINSHNVLYDATAKRCKLIDFGIATRLRSEESRFQSPTGLEGTLAYIAPEQTGRMNRNVDYRADLYSLGMTLYELFAGRLPHESDDPIEMVHFHIAGKVTPLSQFAPDVPEALSNVVMKLLRKASEHRYQSAAGLVADLLACQARLADGQTVEPFALGSKDLADRFELPQQLYGRKAETQKLTEAFQRVANGGVETVLVSGHTGMGKSALVREVQQAITRKRGHFAAGKFDQMRSDEPFSALVAALQGLVEQFLTQSEDAIVVWRRAIGAAVGVNGQVIVDVVPSLELIIGPQPAVAELEAFEAQNRFNRVFQSFIQVLGRKDHPLVLFLDDMQWADQASANLVSLILAAPATESLLVVQAYRDSEVTAGHPFSVALYEQSKLEIPVETINLRPLDRDAVAELVADTLRVDRTEALPLADIVHRKAGGNPFFIRQLLQTLYADKLIDFDAHSSAFHYDAAKIESVAITENVAELLATKLEKLTPASRTVLHLAAAIGNRFDLDTLALVYERTVAETARDLQAALRDGLIVPRSQLESLDPESMHALLFYRSFSFLHDRVQQAAYASIPEGDRPALHLAIGRVLLAADPEQTRLFDIVGHMYQGVALIDDPHEKLELAALGIQAGLKSKRSTAYELAARYFENAVALLGKEGWNASYELTYAGHSGLAESLCLSGEYDAAFAAIQATDGYVTLTIDRTRLETIKIKAYVSLGNMPESLACGRGALALFGVELPQDCDEVGRILGQEIDAILERTSAIGIEQLLELPRMTDPTKMALMESLTHCLPAAYQCDQQHYALLCCKMVSLSLESGNCPLSARAYGSFAALLSSAFEQHETAYRFAKLGVDLGQRLGDPSVLSGVYMLWALFASHWIKPIHESIDLFGKSVTHGLQTGDHQHAGYSTARRISVKQFSGVSLTEVREDLVRGLELLQGLGDANIEFLRPRLRLTDWLRGDRPQGTTLGSAELDEEALMAAKKARGNQSFLADWYLQLTMQRFFARDFESALTFAESGQSVLPFSAAFITRVEHEFYLALTLAALHSQVDAERQAAYATQLQAHEEKLAGWARTCPANFSHMSSLVAAESARTRGDRVEAMDLYDAAIAAAVQYGFVNIEALAAELASRFWFALNKFDVGQVYLDRALNAYELWGALGKADDLRSEYYSRTGGGVASLTTNSTTRHTDYVDSLDLATVLKSSRAISGEIVLENLLAILIDIILENTGAESAALILEMDGEYFIEGLKTPKLEEAQIKLGQPLSEATAVSKGIVNYVIRTKEHVVLADPAEHGTFRNDPYVRNIRPKSVLCAPIVHKGALTGVIYLENNQVSGAFTPDRLEALNILFAQIAVSIENATLYAQQERQTRAIEAANSTLTKEVGERKRAEQELSRYKDHLEVLVAKRTEELENAQGRLVELSRRAGMAEVASGVLHNVGNVMNSVNVGASVARDAVNQLRVEGVGSVCELLEAHAGDLGGYLNEDPAGKKIPLYLRRLGEELSDDKVSILAKVDHVLKHLEHMKKIVAAQQFYARTNGVTEACIAEEIVETALSISQVGSCDIAVVRDYAPLPSALLDRHQILQIVVNLVSNARHALRDYAPQDPTLRVRIANAEAEVGILIEVSDNGVGIAPENMAKVFNHGFTTKTDGHGFGLHNCANAAQQMGGSLTASSDGHGKGATFVLRLPVEFSSNDALETDCA